MAKTNPAAKPKRKRAQRPPAPKGLNHLDEIRKLVHAPNTSKGIVDEVIEYLQKTPVTDQKMKFIGTIVHQSETNTEKVQMLIAYLQTV